MKFLDDKEPPYELTYSDVFIVPNRSDVVSRLDVDITPVDDVGTSVPIVVANMNAVAGARMAETTARRGGLTILPQDTPLEVITKQIRKVKEAHPVFDTAIKLLPDHRIQDANSLIPKRSHGLAIVVDNEDRPVGVYKEADGDGKDRYWPVHRVMTEDVEILPDTLTRAASASAI